ncbi:MAG TPA: GPP34 family phosphoprotein [Pseudonocardiaceae bacterium]|jgi:hypothetical protein
MVTLAEDLFLLAVHKATGRLLIPATYLDLGLGGALLLDLVLRERVALADAHVTVVDPQPVGDSLLDAALATIAGEAKAREPEYRVRHLAKGARAAVQGRLVAAGVLDMDEDRVLGLIPVHHVHQADDRIEHELMDHLSDAVVLSHPASRETAAVVSLALAVGLERHLFPRSDRRAIRQRMQQVAAGSAGAWVGVAVKHAIDAVNASLGVGAGSLVPTES